MATKQYVLKRGKQYVNQDHDGYTKLLHNAALFRSKRDAKLTTDSTINEVIVPVIVTISEEK